MEAQTIIYHTFLTSSVPAPPFFFFAFNFCLFLLRSRFFNPDIPALQTSEYLRKKPSSASSSTIVESFNLSGLLSFDLPSVARIIRESGFVGARSGKGESPVGSGKADESPYVTVYC
jgi:hypothetical protein